MLKYFFGYFSNKKSCSIYSKSHKNWNFKIYSLAPHSLHCIESTLLIFLTPLYVI